MKKIILLFGLLASSCFADQFAADQGRPVIFTATADGTTPFTYVWKKDDAVITGASGATYTIPNVQAVNQGVYQVVISNSAGSASAVLGLTVKPAVIVPPPPPPAVAPSKPTLTASQK